MSEVRFNQLVQRLLGLPTRSVDDAYFLKGFLDGMFEIAKKAEQVKFKEYVLIGGTKPTPGKTWKEWLDYWESKITEFEKQAETR
jgi:hypothetical protein